MLRRVITRVIAGVIRGVIGNVMSIQDMSDVEISRIQCIT